MPALKPKSFTYDVAVDEQGRIATDGTAVELGEEWTADHVLLVAVVRCSIASLAFHARRASLDHAAAGTAVGTVTKPEGEERYRFVSIDVELDVRLDPAPDADALAELLAKAERDCFVGSSLKAKPSYAWRVNA
ncbi:MAG TPA: OsmC family protein [Gaiellaceae bacterium]|nr:OsmC family protein [Gaiellaceae bacterium]